MNRDRRPRRILYLQYTNPAAYPPLEHSARLLAERGWDVVFVGTTDSTALVSPAHPRIRIELSAPAAPGWRQKMHYGRFVAHSVSLARRHCVDWVYASDPLACPAALAVTTFARTRLIYHEHDSPDDTRRASSPFMRAVLAARRQVARRAQLCVLPNAERTERFARRHPGVRCMTVWNCPTRGEVPAVERSDGGTGLRVLYHGSIVPARLPLSVIDALALLPTHVTLVVAGYETAGFPGYVESLRQRAQERGVSARVEFAGTIPARVDLLRQCASCDVGLALMPLETDDLNERAMVGASNKPFDYLACGLALLVSDLPSWRSTFVDNGLAISCDPRSPDSIASALRALADDPARRRLLGARGRDRILADWNYERAFAPVVDVLESDAESRLDVRARGVVPTSPGH